MRSSQNFLLDSTALVPCICSKSEEVPLKELPEMLLRKSGALKHCKNKISVHDKQDTMKFEKETLMCTVKTEDTPTNVHSEE
jgi:hypothetical protein